MVSRTASVAVALLAAALSCTPVDPPAQSGGDCGPVCVSGTANDAVHYRICYPNGGETLRVGDTVILKVCSEDPGVYTYDDMVRELSIDGGASWVLFYTEDDLDTEPHRKHWIVPDRIEYLDTSGNLGSVSVVGDSVLIKVSVYSSAGDPTVDFDITDGHFRIVR